MGQFSKFVQYGQVVQGLLIPEEVFEKTFNKKPRGTAQPGGLYKVYISSANKDRIEQITRLKESWQMQKNIDLGLTPSLLERIKDNRLLEIIEECARGVGYLDVVQAEELNQRLFNIKLRHAEAERKIAKAEEDIKEARQLAENVVTEVVEYTSTEYARIRNIFEETRKRAEEARKKLSTNSQSESV